MSRPPENDEGPRSATPLGALDLENPPAFLNPPALPNPSLAWGSF